MSDGKSRRRLFFALWPSPGIRAGIVARRERIKGLARRPVPDHNLHMTLLYLGDQPGNQPGDRLDFIIDAAGQLDAGGFDMLLDRFGWFERARVAWLGGSAPSAGTALVAQLTAAMSALGLQFDNRPWAPHVTLFRKLRLRPRFPEIEPMAWSIDSFVLIESVPGKPYETLARFGLE